MRFVNRSIKLRKEASEARNRIMRTELDDYGALGAAAIQKNIMMANRSMQHGFGAKMKARSIESTKMEETTAEGKKRSDRQA